MKSLPISFLPTEAGEYNIEIEGVLTMLPMFLKFDGVHWLGLEHIIRTYAFGDVKKVTYYPNE